MTKYEKLKKKYDCLIKESIEKNKPVLIESFIEYYGEEFRNVIIKKINEITFIYYIDWETVDLIIKEFLPQVDNIDKYTAFIEFRNSKTFLSSLFERKVKSRKLPENLIGMTNSSIVNNDFIVKRLFKNLSRPEACSFNYGSVKHMDRIITFQILTLTEKAIIHEINHAITRDNLAYIMDDRSTPIGAISKAGLSVDANCQNNGERIVEELLNDKVSEEIETIFKSKGGDFSDFCLNIPLEYPYEHNFYLIDDFYMQFKKYIKIARISEKKNELISRIGKEEYEEFIRLINKYYSDDISKIESYKEKIMPIIKKLIEKMSKNVDNDCTCSKNEEKEYLERLIELGYHLKMMDFSDNGPEKNNFENDKGTHKM